MRLPPWSLVVQALAFDGTRNQAVDTRWKQCPPSPSEGAGGARLSTLLPLVPSVFLSPPLCLCSPLCTVAVTFSAYHCIVERFLFLSARSNGANADKTGWHDACNLCVQVAGALCSLAELLPLTTAPELSIRVAAIIAVGELVSPPTVAERRCNCVCIFVYVNVSVWLWLWLCGSEIVHVVCICACLCLCLYLHLALRLCGSVVLSLSDWCTTGWRAPRFLEQLLADESNGLMCAAAAVTLLRLTSWAHIEAHVTVQRVLGNITLLQGAKLPGLGLGLGLGLVLGLVLGLGLGLALVLV